MNKDNCSAVDDGLSNSAIVIRDFIELCDIPEDSIKYDFFYCFMNGIDTSFVLHNN